jgi:hypothetical protein
VIIVPQYTAMLEDELGSNPAQTIGMRDKAKPRIFSKKRIVER